MCYDRYTCDAYVAGNTSSVCRLNLETGRFGTSLGTPFAEVNKIVLNPVHRLAALGAGNAPLLSYMDIRTGKTVGGLNLSSLSILEDARGVDITAMRFLENGLTLAVGTSHGVVLLFDIRTRQPYAWKDHAYGLPIRQIAFHEARRCFLTADTKAVKVWSADSASSKDGSLLASVEPPHPANASDMEAAARATATIFLAFFILISS